MAYIEGIVDYVVDISDTEEESLLLHVHANSECYIAIFHDGPAKAIAHLVRKGDRLGLSGTITRSEVNSGWDIDVATIRATVDGKPRDLSVGYRCRSALG